MCMHWRTNISRLLFSSFGCDNMAQNMHHICRDGSAHSKSLEWPVFTIEKISGPTLFIALWRTWSTEGGKGGSDKDVSERGLYFSTRFPLTHIFMKNIWDEAPDSSYHNYIDIFILVSQRQSSNSIDNFFDISEVLKLLLSQVDSENIRVERVQGNGERISLRARLTKTTLWGKSAFNMHQNSLWLLLCRYCSLITGKWLQHQGNGSELLFSFILSVFCNEKTMSVSSNSL